MFRDCSEDTPMQSWDKWPVEQSPAGATQRPWVGQPGERPADNKTAEAAESGIGDLYDPCRWGLRLKRSPPWEHGCTSFGCGFATVSRPARVTPARTPTTLCAVS